MKYVIVDIDGTIAKSHKRQAKILHLIKTTPHEEMPWKELFADLMDDEPIGPIVSLIRSLHREYHIIFCTSRNVEYRDQTRDWIDLHTGTTFWKSPLLMRPSADDHRSDSIVKPELLEEAGINTENTAFIIEDKNSMVATWRELGFTVLQPANNEF